MPRIAIAAIVASLVPPALVSIFGVVASGGHPSGLLFVAAAAWIVGLIHIIFLGLPLFIFLLRRNSLTLAHTAVAGLLTGALSNAVISYPRTLEGYSSGQNWHGKYVDIYVNGEPTYYAWLTYAESCVYMGIYGLLTAATAWLVWRSMSETQEGIDV